MKETEKNNFGKMLTAVSELYGKKMSSALLNIYWTSLERFNFSDICQAINQHVNNPNVGQFMPKPADVVRYIEGGSETHALQAWAKVESTIRRVGSYESISFDDPIIHTVIVEMGGWPKLCATLAQEMPFRANEFIKRYQSYFQKVPVQYMKYLPGVFEQANAASGYLDGTIPVLIGDEHAALAVLKNGSCQSSISIHQNSLLAKNLLKVLSAQTQFTLTRNIDDKDSQDE